MVDITITPSGHSPCRSRDRKAGVGEICDRRVLSSPDLDAPRLLARRRAQGNDGTRSAVQERLRSELAKVIAQPELQETFRKAGGKPLALNTAQTLALVKRDVERWTKLVRDIGIKAE